MAIDSVSAAANGVAQLVQQQGQTQVASEANAAARQAQQQQPTQEARQAQQQQPTQENRPSQQVQPSQAAQHPAPVVNTLGQTTGTQINTTA